MLVTLCTLITALTCVSGVTVVTQKPPVLSVRKGETATMDCNLGTVTNSDARWYKQIPGGVPQYVLYFYHSYSSPTYGSGFSAPKFTSTHQSTSDYRLIIKNVEEGDSAVYYFPTRFSSCHFHASVLVQIAPTTTVRSQTKDFHTSYTLLPVVTPLGQDILLHRAHHTLMDTSPRTHLQSAPNSRQERDQEEGAEDIRSAADW
uniref:Immunoglobulin domain-containing protein n=1 Tax=Oreochromis aureus TaxID=47969 RepID=A0AAZ1WZM5_OREAU